MSGHQFELFLQTHFERKGYKVKRTAQRGDYGADLLLNKNGCSIAVQAKRYNKNVGLKAVQEIVGAKYYYRCNKAMVISNRNFTPQAEKLAAKNEVELWGRKKLMDELITVNRKQRSG